MSTFEKRAREDKRDQKQRDKDARRREKRLSPRSHEPELVTADQIAGNLRSIEDVMASLTGGRVDRSAAPIPAKLFVGSLSPATTNASLRAHFEPHGALVEAVVITDRDTGVSRNFGFVTMADRKDASRAIDALHRSELDGNRIVVNVATER